ncbi:C40 family peptidase [Streptomyces sp. NPDC089919]|uniref:C40 family peptidase n=1 Tax=Streptomyces sp. NPDC089919 TaxID=3155188 RepID=UPI00344083C6
MPGRLLRLVCAAATAGVALAAAAPPSAAGAPPAAVREPAPDTAPDSAPDPAPGDGPVPADAKAGGVKELLGRLQTLYREAEEASEAYNATEVALDARRKEERRLSGDLGKARTTLGAGRAAAGRLARQQYQGAAGFSPYVRMLLSGDPGQALDERRLARREAAHQAGVLARLAGAEKRADSLATEARKALDTQQTLAAKQKAQRDGVRSRLTEVEKLLASLTADQLAELGELERAGTEQAQQQLEDSGRLGPGGTRAPTAEGGAALEYAAEQIGKPYVWGAEGPASFDCSGLTSQAWAHAGRAIPRTSQEQWAQLPKVPLNELRPGDLVLYFPKATHVAIYLGKGMVIQAPRPGARVKVSPIAANPLLGAVRPDPGGRPLAEYSPPPLPKEAAAEGTGGGDDSGYSSEEAPAAAATEAETSAR